MLFVVDVEKINENLNKLQRADNFYLDFLLRIAEGIENKLENITNDKEKLLKEYEFYNLYSLLIYCAMHSLKLFDNHSIHVIYNRPQNPSNSADTLEAAMLAQGVC